MTLSQSETLLLVAVIAVCTCFTRALPFLIFAGRQKTPKYILYLGEVLPFAMIGMLVVYCWKDVSFLQNPWGLPELIATGYIVLVHKWKHSLLLSIGGGIVLYILLCQFVFA
ncbi:MAG: AzlD domain-containing protein [Oscillospiraceae bacterium]|nr:AzlD domain-containing protein [Oscillospiraceae bacterium]